MPLREALVTAALGPRCAGGDGAPAARGGPPEAGAELARLAVAEQVAPLLGKRVTDGALAAAPEIAATLFREYRECLTKALLREAAAAPILRAVRDAGIPVMWLKGAALVRTVYCDPGARWMGDIDVLVPAARWREAREVAAGAGAAPIVVPGRAVTSDRDYVAALRAPGGAAAGGERAGGGAVLELHRYFGPRPLFRVDYDAVIAAGLPDGAGFLLPAPADLFVSLALHAAKHGFIVPFRAVIDALALAPSVDAAAVADRAAAWHARRAVAIWVAVLLRYGLDPRWRALATPDPVAAAIARHAPYAAEDRTTRSWRSVARIMGATDGPARAAGYLLQRVALRVADAIH